MASNYGKCYDFMVSSRKYEFTYEGKSMSSGYIWRVAGEYEEREVNMVSGRIV